MSDSGKTGENSINRRHFIAASTAAGLWLSTGPRLLGSGSGLETSKVYMVKGTSRAAIIPKLLDMFGRDSLNSAVSGKWVIVKPNFNSAHEFPGISHYDTVKILLSEIGKAGPSKVTVTDRSGMGKSSFVVQKMDAEAFAVLLEVCLVLLAVEGLGLQRHLGKVRVVPKQLGERVAGDPVEPIGRGQLGVHQTQQAVGVLVVECVGALVLASGGIVVPGAKGLVGLDHVIAD